MNISYPSSHLPRDTRDNAAGPGSAGAPDAGSKSRPRVWAAYVGFFVAVFASMAAAATVAGSDIPLMVVGL